MLSVKCLFAQSFDEEFKFFNHLYTNNLNQEGLTQLDQMENLFTKKGQLDTIYYFRGKIYYERKELALASFYYSQVNRNNQHFWQASRFFAGLSNSYLAEYDKAEIHFNSPFKDAKLNSLANFELAGVALLKRDLEAFKTYENQFQSAYFEFSAQEENLSALGNAVGNFKRKSPLLAALFSAIIPGSGKIYAGKTGQGIAGLLTTSVFGLQAYEGYRKDGLRSARFIIYGSIFSAFYIANIWGSALSIKVRRDEFNQEINEAILVDLHIPLRTIFK